MVETLRLGGKLLITADHGNCEYMRNGDGSPNTAHTTNLVHLFYVGQDAEKYNVRDGILADVAPTLLEMMGLKQPKEMTGKSLLVAKPEKTAKPVAKKPVEVAGKKEVAKKAIAKNTASGKAAATKKAAVRKVKGGRQWRR